MWRSRPWAEDIYSRRGAWFAGDVGGVDAGFCKACDTDPAHLIAADL
jgi:hypothetical protein